MAALTMLMPASSCKGITLLLARTCSCKGSSPHKSRPPSQINGKEKPLSSKLKSAIQSKSHKKAQALKSANRDGNKEIADFNLQKSAAIFANELREGQKNRDSVEIHVGARCFRTAPFFLQNGRTHKCAPTNKPYTDKKEDNANVIPRNARQ